MTTEGTTARCGGPGTIFGGVESGQITTYPPARSRGPGQWLAAGLPNPRWMRFLGRRRAIGHRWVRGWSTGIRLELRSARPAGLPLQAASGLLRPATQRDWMAARLG